MRRAPLAAVLCLAGLPSLAAAADPPAPALATPAYDPQARYRAVHVDTLDPHLRPVFEQARVEWLKVLAAHRTTDGRGAQFLAGGHTIVTLRSFASFTEYDALRAFRAGVNGRLGPGGAAASERYDQGDVALRQPHNSEVWARDEELDYRGSGALSEYTAGYMQMTTEHAQSPELRKAWKEIAAALATARYPLGRVGFVSSPGTGQTITLWLAADRAAFEAAGTPFAAVSRVLGPEKAQELFARHKSGSTVLVIQDFVPRPDLRSPE
jgi:hypothetical protein